jgi:hypothetical protein
MGLRPTPAFARVALDIATVPADATYRRIFLARYPDALGFGKSPSRFSDPRRRVPDSRFGVLYLGSTLKVCFLEAILRDQRNGKVGDYPIDEAELRARVAALITPARPLRLIDLRGDGPVRMGIPSDVVRGSVQTIARAWSVAFHDHPDEIDGILYPSRLNEEHNLAIYDRAVPALRANDVRPLLTARGIAAVLDDLKVALI